MRNEELGIKNISHSSFLISHLCKMQFIQVIKNNINLKKLRQPHILILILTLILFLIGSMVVFSTTFVVQNSVSRLFINQLLFYFVGIWVICGLWVMDYKLLMKRDVQIFISVFTIILLILVLFIGESVGEARRWINFGAFSLQPSEVAKVSIILLLAVGFHYRPKIKDQRTKNQLSIVIGLTIGFFVLLTFLQRSLGNTVLSVGLVMLMIFSHTKVSLHFLRIILSVLCGLLTGFVLFQMITISNLEYKNLAIIILCFFIFTLLFTVFRNKTRSGVILLLLFLISLPIYSFGHVLYQNVLQPYQRARIETFLAPSHEDTLNSKWNERQALTAIGSGLLTGKGFLKGTHANIGYIPYAHTDFAYAAFAEQFGFLGSIFLVIVYGLLLTAVLRVGSRTKDTFGQTICYGVAILFFLNIVQHVGMNLGLLPITGVPLPFISYGGSSVLIYSIGIGLVLSIHSTKENKRIEVIDLRTLNLKRPKPQSPNPK